MRPNECYLKLHGREIQRGSSREYKDEGPLEFGDGWGFAESKMVDEICHAT